MARFRDTFHRHWLNLILGPFLVSLLANFLLGRDGPRDLFQLLAIRSQLTNENDQLRRENARFETQVSRLHNDDAYVQSLIRSELGYIRPDEVTYRFRSDNASRD